MQGRAQTFVLVKAVSKNAFCSVLTFQLLQSMVKYEEMLWGPVEYQDAHIDTAWSSQLTARRIERFEFPGTDPQIGDSSFPKATSRARWTYL